MATSSSSARARPSLKALAAVHVALVHVGSFVQVAATAAAQGPTRYSAGFVSARAVGFKHRVTYNRGSPWVSRTGSHRPFRRPRGAVRTMATGDFNPVEIVDHLEHDYKGDLALLAQKFGTMIESVDDIEEVHVSEIDGDHMSLDVVYCDRGEQTCVAVAVPIKFPYHCDDEECIINAIHELEELENVVPSSEVQLPKKHISPELMETIARISVVMNRDFQDELVSFVRAFGGNKADRPTGECEMISLSPDGFTVQAALFPDEPVTVTFPRECICAQDFQKQILFLSQEAMVMTSS